MLSADLDVTPRPSQWNGKHNTKTHQSGYIKGFTLSYLRRVPELAELAHKVVEVERKRRSREQRQRQKDAARAGNEAILSKVPTEPTSKKTKRLYMWALRELHREGSIILQEDDAPVWEYIEFSKASEGIWKTSKRDHSSAALDTGNNTTMTSNTSVTDEKKSHWDPDELSDPPVHEESYVPLTPDMLMEPIIEAIKGFMIRKPHTKRSTVQQSSGTYRGSGSTVVGPTAEELHEYLRKVDARWENVGEYTVKDALDLLKKQEKVYRAGNGRWALSI